MLSPQQKREAEIVLLCFEIVSIFVFKQQVVGYLISIS